MTPEIVLLRVPGRITIDPPQNSPVRVVERLAGFGAVSCVTGTATHRLGAVGSSPRGGSLTHRVIGCTACPHSETPSTRRSEGHAYVRYGQVVQRGQGLRIHHPARRIEGLLRPPLGDPGQGVQDPDRR